MRKGLTRRTIVASGVLALLVGAAFAVLLRAFDVERDAGRQVMHSQQVLSTANAVERLLLDLETGQRGYLITGEERFLEPWFAARRQLPRATADLERLAIVAAQDRRAHEIV